MAINFPATSGQPTDGSYTHTVGNITWLWDGISWRSGVSTSVNEADPIFTASAAGSISSTHINNWNNAYNWGDHSQAGYLTSVPQGATVTVADDPPSNPVNGDLWWESDTGFLKIYYEDGDSNQWIDAAPSGGITLSDLSVSTAAAGTAGLSYDNTTGVLTYTPPDLSGYLTSLPSHGINDHSDVDTTTNAPSNNDVLKWDGTNNEWVPGSIASSGGALALTDFSVQTSGAGTPSLLYDNTSGVFTYTPPDLSSYLTSYTETSTLANVISRGSTSNDSATIGGDGTASGVTLSDGNISLRTGTGNVASIDLYCEVNNAHFVSVKAPAHANFSGNVNFTLPENNGTLDQLLRTDGLGNTSWVDASSLTESDTLDTVTGRGAITANDITVGKLSIGDAAGNTGANSVVLGDSDDAKLYYLGSADTLQIQSDKILLRAKSALEDPIILGEYNAGVKLYYAGTTKLETTSAGITVAGSIIDGSGKTVRQLECVSKTASYTLASGDAGKTFIVSGNNATITIPNATFVEGDIITIINNTATNIIIAQDTGLSIYYTSDATGATGNRTAAARSSSTILFISGTTAYLSGTGLS